MTFKFNEAQISNSEIVKLIRELGKDRYKEILPSFLKVQLNSHSTAVHCRIYLINEGVPDLLVWYKTNWSSPNYEFNERGKVIGLQSGCEFIEAELTMFFSRCNQKAEELKADRLDREKRGFEKEKAGHAALIEAHKAALAGGADE